MEIRWRHVVAFADYVYIWPGMGGKRRGYPLMPESRQRLEVLLGDAIEPAAPGQSWEWSWNDWDWHNVGGK